MWSVILLSQYKDSEWTHIETTSYLKITAELSQNRLDIYLSFFSSIEKIDSIDLLCANIQKRHSSVGIFLSKKKIQLKLPSSNSADELARKIHYTQMMHMLSSGLLSISVKYKQNNLLL